MPNVVARTWEYWTMRLQASGGWPPKPAAKKTDDEAQPKPTPAAERKKRQ